MAKKKTKFKFHKKFIWIPGGIAVAVLIILFPILNVLGDVNPIYNAADFEVPDLSIQDTQMNENIEQQIDEIINDPQKFCSASSAEIQLAAECSILTAGETFTNDPGGAGSIDGVCAEAQTITDPQCQQEIDQLIQELQNQLIIPDPINNQTQNSDDPPPEQICDLINCEENPILDPILPEPQTVILQTSVTKVTSQGLRLTTERAFDLPSQALLVEDETNLDFANGSIEFELFAVTDPTINFTGTGKLDVKIGQVNINPSGFDITVGINDGQGNTKLLINNQQVFSLFLSNELNKFTNEAVTPIVVSVREITLSDGTNTYANQDLELFTMNIFRDDIQVLIIDTQGNTVRSFPNDSRLVLNSVASNTQYEACRVRQIGFTSDFKGNGLGCSQPYIFSDIGNGVECINTATIGTVPIPAPTISGISLTSSDGTIISTSTGGTGNSLYDFNQIIRNDTYTLKANGGIFSQLDYGKAQETQSFTCTQEGTANQLFTTVISGQTGPCQTYYQITTKSLNTLNPLTLGVLQCNLP